jgi:glycosyltransferase involved in cell wall biosynthesis
MQWAEDLAYRSADRVVSILPKTMEHMCARGMAPDKFAHVPNGVDAAEWTRVAPPLPAEHSEALDRIVGSGNIAIGYAGAHGVANSLDTIIDAATLLQDVPATFVLVGDGPEKERLQRRVAAADLRNVVFLPTISKAMIPSLLSRFDVACLTLRREPLFRFGISPNKLMDYMMAGRPVLHAVDAGNDLVAESGCGVSVRAQDPTALADGVRRFVAMSRVTREELGARGREFILANNEYSVLGRQFLDVLNDACARRRLR